MLIFSSSICQSKDEVDQVFDNVCLISSSQTFAIISQNSLILKQLH